jgi:hypothetical protein
VKRHFPAFGIECEIGLKSFSRTLYTGLRRGLNNGVISWEGNT